MKEIETIRAALDKWHKAVTAQESQKAESEYVDATEQDVMSDVLAHIDNQQSEIDALTGALAECRDSMPVPSPGSAREVAWGQAIGSPADVPQYVKEASNELLAEITRLEADAARYQWLKQAKGLTLESERGAPWTREDGSTFSPSHRLCADGTQFGPEESLDAAIDAAREHP